MARVAALLLAVILCAAAAPALAADQADETTALKDQVRSLKDANVVMKEDLAKTHLQLAEMAKQARQQADATKRELAEMAKQVADVRKALADERARHEAALRDANAEAARQRDRAKSNRMWLYALGGAALLYAATQ